MKQTLLLLAVIFSLNATAQKDNKWNGFRISPEPTYPATDTLPCYFMEVIDTDNVFSTFWSKGYVIREKGFFTFDGLDDRSTSVTVQYLPITAGILKNKVLYDDKITVVKNNVIQIVLKQIKL